MVEEAAENSKKSQRQYVRKTKKKRKEGRDSSFPDTTLFLVYLSKAIKIYFF